MYRVLCDNALMYDSRIEELALINPVLNLEENRAGSFSFTIAPVQPFYDKIEKRKSIIEVYQDEDLLFSGTCIEEGKDFYKQKNVYCEGELSFLNDSIQRPARYQGTTVRGLLEAYIAVHNSQVEEAKRFTVGIVTVTDPNDSLYCFTNMESTMQALKKDLVDDLGGFIRIRHENGVKYIDYLADSQDTNTQTIKIGKNLMDFTSNVDSSEIATAIIPLGARLEESTVQGLDTRLTIESVNDGRDYVYSQEAVDTYGWIYKSVEWDSVTTPEALKRKGEQYLADIQYENMVIEAKAVDLHLTDKEIERFKLSDQIRVYSAPHGLDRYFRLTKLSINLNNPAGNTITLGKDEKVTLSAKSNQASEEIKKAIESIVPSADILKMAAENATNLIATAMGGYIVKTEDELLIMDTNSTDTATKVWRWNINGLGYSSNGYAGPYSLAMTMDGSIIADFIKSGVLTGIEINNGSGTFHVDANGNLIANSLVSSNANITGGRLTTFSNSGNYKTQIDSTGFSITKNDIELLYTSTASGYLSLIARDESLNKLFEIANSGVVADTLVVSSTEDNALSANGKCYFAGGASIADNVVIYPGNFTCYGTKSRAVITENFKDRLLYCYEMPTPFFGDIGEARLDETGTCYIYIDDIFLETIDTECMYQVFLQKYGEGECIIAERNRNHFIVKGTPGLAFAWEIKAKQAGYTMERLEEYTQEEKETEINYEAEASAYLSEYERQVLNYE